MSLPSRDVAVKAAAHLRDLNEHARLLETYVDDVLRGSPLRLDILRADIDRGVPKILHSLADMANLQDLGVRFYAFLHNVDTLVTPWIALRNPEGIPRADVFHAASTIAAARGQTEFALRTWARYAETGEAPDMTPPAAPGVEVA